MVIIIVAGALVGFGIWLWAGVGNERLQVLLRRPDDEQGMESAVADRGQKGPFGNGDRGTHGSSTADALAFDLELAAICLGSGLPTDHALALAAGAGQSASGLGRLARAVQLGERVDDGPLAQVAELIEFSSSTGVALAPLLRGLANDLRRSEHRRRQLAAARLGTQLVIPLGVCILPSFVLLGVIPVLLTLVGDFGQLFGA